MNFYNLLKSEKFQLPILLIFSSALFFIQLGSSTFWERSEPTYAEIAREIAVTGDWLTLHYDFSNWYVHPPLYFWLTAALGSLLGFSEWTTRFISALFGVGGVLLTYLLGRELYNSRVGFIAGLVLTLSLEYFVLSRIVLMDTLLNFFTLGALYGFLIAYRRGNRNYLLWMYLSMALAILSKGPVGIVLPLMLIFFFLLFKKDLPYILSLFQPRGILLFLLIVSPWYISQILLHGFDFIRVNILSYTFGRYFGVVEEQAGPFYYYLPVLLLGFFPWVGYLVSSWLFLYKEKSDSALFLLISSLVILIFFSLAGTKLPNYILTLYPLMAVSLAHLFDAWITERSPWLSRQLTLSNVKAFVLTALLIIAGLVFYKQIGPPYNESVHLLLPLAILSGVGIFLSTLLFLLRKDLILSASVQGLMVLSLIGFVMFYGLPEADKYKPFKAFVTQIGNTFHTGDKIGVYRYYSYSMVFYSGSLLKERIHYFESESDLKTFLFSKERVYLMVFDQDYEKIKRSGLVPHIYVLSEQKPFLLISNKAK